MKPILFNTDMVCAILAGRKTVTRRVVKPQPPSSTHPNLFVSPTHRPGDILYVRETWTQDGDVYRYKAGFYDQNRKWRPSIHMPREAARIFLRVADVRVERLQEIPLADCIAEGIPGMDNRFPVGNVGIFAEFWDSALKPADRALYGWEANPYVRVIGFERCEKPKGG